MATVAPVVVPSVTSDVDAAVHPAALRIVVGSRVMNSTIAALALIAGAPLLLLIAVAVKLTSRGPVLYRQQRVGLDRRRSLDPVWESRRTIDYGGKLFTMYKFRSMHVDAEQACGAVWASPDDPRVTKAGRFLRRYRLDELPQLYNVLRGDMNIVGPRPERPTIFADLRQQIPDYAHRQRAKPGITGLAQISHHYDRDVDDVRIKLQYDLQYVLDQSTLTDLKIMLRTVPAVIISRRGW